MSDGVALPQSWDGEQDSRIDDTSGNVCETLSLHTLLQVAVQEYTHQIERICLGCREKAYHRFAVSSSLS